MIDPQILEKLEDMIVATSTGGDWFAYQKPFMNIWIIATENPGKFAALDEDGKLVASEMIAEFIAEAHNSLPLLLTALRVQERRIKELEEKLNVSR
jgi:hypothetical protein